MLPPQKLACFAVMRNAQENIRNSTPAKNCLFCALSDGVCKINDSTPRRNNLVFAGVFHL